MLVLAFDTATAAVTVALYEWTPGEGVRCRGAVEEARTRKHTELLVPAVAGVLADAGAVPGDLSALVVGTGPGPYTGLRVGLATARAMGDALRVPVHGVCSLDVIAWASGRDAPFAVATDARRKEVYWARYASAAVRTAGPAVGPPADVRAGVPDGLPVIGEGAALYPEVLGGTGDGFAPLLPSAAALAELAIVRLSGRKGPDLTAPEPLYLRRPDAKEPGPRKKVTPA
ncbi:tRNA (adenosine(37)-N6)-threonylcarbamoyltransferase complex dimerization subunit type 1 TsaB [Actinomadura parmotrematis]|uniref:tRNA (Adenosine(37)-N6)-threonylcarbamoyltransferase complex dimerization subunit type 1 TsaB n=1 Tax=Actinomadura parmotrematis TaxID=2864039 RepID=A0ABS7G401_9ACTN|nr:tRNA (adenosine(37)-N6)-threonylcarbamoyltransferase complex dimerization subunit type 1 TsaB [Actinomadura parmotrematis]MBW8487427.1 tRNA (adenosine(37)-N6)-threonylcarbamoyltransferase complex dimerization subunit type 1 TsaB [Actinomadura parmotrematis]